MLQAIRLDAYDHFQFRIEAPTLVPVITGDAAQAAEVLRQLGVTNPGLLVVHAQSWGQVEIAEPSG